MSTGFTAYQRLVYEQRFAELNIDFIHRMLAIEVLNYTKNTDKAAEIIGISKRTMWRWKRIYAIKYNTKTGRYYSDL